MIPTSILILGGRGAGKTYQALQFLKLFPHATLIDVYAVDLSEHRASMPSTSKLIVASDPLAAVRDMDGAGRDVIVCLTPREKEEHDAIVEALQFGDARRNFIHMRMGRTL